MRWRLCLIHENVSHTKKERERGGRKILLEDKILKMMWLNALFLICLLEHECFLIAFLYKFFPYVRLKRNLR